MNENLKPRERIILALKDMNVSEAISLLDVLKGKLTIVKVDSLAAVFPQIVPIITIRGMKVWRDWKYYDTPATVGNFIKADIKAGITITTIHTLGGTEMMKYAVRVAKGTDLKILGITILGDQKSFFREIGIPGAVRTKITELSLRAERIGLSGIVASAREAEYLRRFLKPDTLIVTPGIKPDWMRERRRQARTTTPFEAIKAGADYIVVGSAIYKSPNPSEAVNRIAAEIEKALEERE